MTGRTWAILPFAARVVFTVKHINAQKYTRVICAYFFLSCSLFPVHHCVCSRVCTWPFLPPFAHLIVKLASANSQNSENTSCPTPDTRVILQAENDKINNTHVHIHQRWFIPFFPPFRVCDHARSFIFLLSFFLFPLYIWVHLFWMQFC